MGSLWCGGLIFFAISSRSSQGLVVLPMLAVGIAVFSRLFRIRVRADSEGLLVRNRGLTRRFSWDQVEDFRLGDLAQLGPMSATVIHVIPIEGNLARLDATSRLLVANQGQARLDDYLAALRSWVPTHRTPPARPRHSAWWFRGHPPVRNRRAPG